MDSLIVSVICRMVVPFIQIYGLYIIFYGHLSPGGSFSGGSILAASMIFYELVFGLRRGKQLLPERSSEMIEIFGVLWFLGLGLVGVLTGSYFLANRAGGFNIGTPGNLFSSGMIIMITVGLGIKVASTLSSLFFEMTENEGGPHGD